VVLVYLRRRSGDPELSADLTAETFAAALVSVHRGHVDGVDNGAAWLLDIARHKLIDSFRRGRAELAALEKLGLPRPSVDDEQLARIYALAGLSDRVRSAFATLTPDERGAVVERVLLERDCEQIAQAGEQSAAVVRKRVSRGLGRLRHVLGARR
jgi:RNA polymerase sigma-70 factor (ECF subfamily)